MHALLQYIFVGRFAFAKNSSCAIVGILMFCTTSIYSKMEVRGINYYNLKEIASKLNLKLHYKNSHEEGILKGPNVEIHALKGKRYIKINNISVWLGYPIFLHKNDLYITERDFLQAIAPIVIPNNCSMIGGNLYHIVIDPGHGGKDEGTRNAEYHLKEKDLTLDVSIRLIRELEQRGYKVTLTRRNDHFLGLKERPEFANQQKADLFISIHFNAVEAGKNSVKGVETFILPLHNDPSTAENNVTHNDENALPGNKYDTLNTLLGYNIQRQLVHDLQTTDRGLRRGRLAVLKTLNCPGVLVEVGFLSNNEECEKFRLPGFRQKIAQSIAEGVVYYHSTVNAGRK